MGKSADKKRKRESDVQDDAANQPASKKVQVSDTEAASVTRPAKESKVGSQRQKKSERSKKRDLQAKQNAAAKKAAAAADDIDGLAAGQDYIKLDGDTETPVIESTGTKRETFKFKAAKRSSPRSIRKAERARKALEKASEAGVALGEAAEEPSSGNASKSRFIVFVGNLPYSATSEEVTAHFVKLRPAAIRHMTDKSTGKSKGYAFLEFEDYDRMKTCLSQYHQSLFDPHGEGEDEAVVAAPEGTAARSDTRHSKSSARRLNVELTAGGGGKSSGRKTKIKEKNQKLGREREKARQNLKKKKGKEDEKKALAVQRTGGVKLTGANAEGGAGSRTDTVDRGAIHPSRMSRVQG